MDEPVLKERFLMPSHKFTSAVGASFAGGVFSRILKRVLSDSHLVLKRQASIIYICPELSSSAHPDHEDDDSGITPRTASQPIRNTCRAIILLLRRSPPFALFAYHPAFEPVRDTS